MKAVRCDRCGAVVTQDGSGTMSLTTAHGRYLAGWDLCDPCIESFYAWQKRAARPALPDPMPPAYHETIPGLLGWIGEVAWDWRPWRWHWKDHPRPWERRTPS